MGTVAGAVILILGLALAVVVGVPWWRRRQRDNWQKTLEHVELPEEREARLASIRRARAHEERLEEEVLADPQPEKKRSAFQRLADYSARRRADTDE